MAKENHGNEHECEQCGGCCNHIAIQLDTPEDKEDFSNILWYILHENVNIFIGDDDNWYVEFITPCSELQPDNSCGVYHNRPLICREYDPDECVKHGDGEPEKFKFRNKEDLFAYMRLRGLNQLDDFQ
mgnify:CR=1 FL=1